jgi:regulator of protease activity HflC (stomatin/prohibitin superfamily)
MKLIPFTFFKSAGPNDFVAFTRAGRERKTGRGLAGFLLPGTSVVVVPLGVKTVNFAVSERTKDNQLVEVTGELVVVNTADMRKYFDFSVEPENGMYRNDPTVAIEDQVRIAVRTPIRAMLASMTVEAVGAEVGKISETLNAAVADENSDLMQRLKRYAIKVESVSVKSAEPADEDLSEALGAREREEMLTAMDDAIADRRRRAAEKDRDIRKYEEETALKLAEDQAERVAQEGRNKVATAEAEAAAAAKLLEPYGEVDPGKMLALSLMEAAKRGLRSVSIDPGLLAAIKGAAREE